MKLVLKRSKEAPKNGGSLLEYIAPKKEYEVIDTDSRAGCLILDDRSKKVWVSKSCFKEYFNIV